MFQLRINVIVNVTESRSVKSEILKIRLIVSFFIHLLSFLLIRYDFSVR
jgi:hypothetical protein